MATKNKAYTLVGVDSNAFSIMGYTAKAMRDSGKNKADIEAYIEAYISAAMSGNYDQLIAKSMDILDDLNKANGVQEPDNYEDDWDDEDDYEDDYEDDEDSDW